MSKVVKPKLSGQKNILTMGTAGIIDFTANFTVWIYTTLNDTK